MKEPVPSARIVTLHRPAVLDYVALAKPELTLLSVVSALGGAYLAAGAVIPLGTLIHLLLGTLMVGGGAGALNQYAERGLDVKMRRTESRPLPSGRVSPRRALVFGSGLATAGVLELLLFTTMPAAFLAVVTLVTYLFLYTPLKRISPFATVVGGIPGALPPMIGWSAVTGTLSIGAWSLFFILFFWQMPHFLSLGWMYRKDYARAEYKLLTVVDETGVTVGRQILVYSIALLPAVVVPSMVKMVGVFYLIGALAFSFGFLVLAVRFVQDRTNANARMLFYGSLIYLSGLLALMMVDRAV